MVDDEVDDRGGVAQHPVADVDDEHGGGSGDDEAAGVVQLTEDYGLGWIHEMAVAHDHLFYAYMVSLSRGSFIRGFIVSFLENSWYRGADPEDGRRYGLGGHRRQAGGQEREQDPAVSGQDEGGGGSACGRRRSPVTFFKTLCKLFRYVSVVRGQSNQYFRVYRQL